MGLTTDRRYTNVAIALHWIIAACIVFNLSTGQYMEGLKGEPKHLWVSLHSSAGLTVLVLSFARVAWRLTHRPPALDEHLTRLEKFAAEAVHGLLYVLMIVVPLAGWSISSASTRPGAGAELYFLMYVPKIWLLKALPMAEKIAVHDQAVWLHMVSAWTMCALVVGHVLGALKHQFFDRQPQFARMWFGQAKPEA
ncbi:cytochrome b [Novosphingobium flavum]|uniref:Cytochrome b n=1 Tax=Novosphingobium flavum TaxID=1778672 RepID=A0A7X1FUC2_9SPHN|nr:cytochrome b [Novosphingobium flavum]MBC2667126.1 cytochrome b [Novosphingobium flavum]